MGVSPVLIVLLAMAIGGVVGFEVGKSAAKKEISQALQNAAESMKKAQEEQKKERDRRFEEIRESAAKFVEQWEDILKGRRAPMQKELDVTTTTEIKEKEQN